jgi:hypothetical protein
MLVALIVDLAIVHNVLSRACQRQCKAAGSEGRNTGVREQGRGGAVDRHVPGAAFCSNIPRLFRRTDHLLRLVYREVPGLNLWKRLLSPQRDGNVRQQCSFSANHTQFSS